MAKQEIEMTREEIKRQLRENQEKMQIVDIMNQLNTSVNNSAKSTILLIIWLDGFNHQVKQ